MTSIEFVKWLGASNHRITNEEKAQEAVEYASALISPLSRDRIYCVAGLGCPQMTQSAIARQQDVGRQAVSGSMRFKQRLRLLINSWGEEIKETHIDPDSLKSLIFEGEQTHIRNYLRQNKVTTVTQLCQCTEQEILSFWSFGPKMVGYIKDALALRGLSLRADSNPKPTS